MTQVGGVTAGWWGESLIPGPPLSTLASPGQFKAAMRKLTGGVTVVTAASDGSRVGVTATAICSVSAEPPHLLCCINTASMAHGPIHSAGAYCLNVLAHDQENVARCFAGWDKTPHERRFDNGRWTSLTTGAPALDGALANFDCIVTQEISLATHTIFIGRVVGVRIEDRSLPLIYSEGRFTTLKQEP